MHATIFRKKCTQLIKNSFHSNFILHGSKWIIVVCSSFPPYTIPNHNLWLCVISITLIKTSRCKRHTEVRRQLENVHMFIFSWISVFVSNVWTVKSIEYIVKTNHSKWIRLRMTMSGCFWSKAEKYFLYIKCVSIARSPNKIKIQIFNSSHIATI